MATITSYKSGIDLTLSGAEGADWMVEGFLHDPRLWDGRVIYLKSATQIGFTHNARNVAGVPAPAGTLGEDRYVVIGTGTPDDGQVRYKIDGDRKWDHRPDAWRSYTADLTFSTLTYELYGDAGVPVLGAVGGNGLAFTAVNFDTHYHRGITGAAGNEYHTITVCDWDASSSSSEFRASDSMVLVFCVNPKTPCLKVTASGTAQFYTTPIKTYQVPYIYDQTTYCAPGDAGAVSFEIRDINGNNVFYRIGGGSFINAGASFKVLEDVNFADGTNTLQYYFAGNAAYTKTRTIVKNPAFPSAAEQHGDRFWVNAAQWTAQIAPKFAVGGSKEAAWLTLWRTKNSKNSNQTLNSEYGAGLRKPAANGGVNAFLARYYGVAAPSFLTPAYTYAHFAKISLLDNLLALDPVGADYRFSGSPLPTREMLYRGYYDDLQLLPLLYAYDYTAGYYRSDQRPGGMTAVEDWFVRDRIASWMQVCGCASGGWTDDLSFNVTDMWPGAHKMMAGAITGIMPNYSTRYFGTSGLDGNLTTYNHIIFPPVNYRWFDLYLDNAIYPPGYPALANGLGLEESRFAYKQGRTSASDPGDGIISLKWNDRISYSETPLMGHSMANYYCFLKLFHPTKNLPVFNQAMTLAAAGTLRGSKFEDSKPSDFTPRFNPWLSMCNGWFPDFRDAVALSITSAQIDSEMNSGRLMYITLYNTNLPLGGGPAERCASPSPSVPAGDREGPASVALSTATTGAAVHYTTDGTTPTAGSPVYSALIPVVSPGLTIKAVAIKGGAVLNSLVQTLPYTFPYGGRPAPVQILSVTSALAS